MEKVLVTGGLGFIGSYTVDKLVTEGYEVTVLDNLERQVHLGKFPKFINKDANYIRGDIRFQKHWLKALPGVDYIIHLAGAVGTGQSFWQPRKYLSINTLGTATLYEILIKNRKIKENIEKIVVASSKSINGEGAYRCEVHGPVFPETRSIEILREHIWEHKCPICGGELKPIPLTESKPLQNPNPYSLGKYTTENLALQYSKLLDIPTVAFRYFNVYGPRQSLNNPYTGVLAIFLSRMKNGNSPLLFEDGGQLRDYIYVKDVADANVKALKVGEGCYNIGTGKPTSLLKIVENLNELLGTKIEPKISKEFRVGDNRHDYASMEKFYKDFGKTNFLKLEDGMRELVNWSLSESSEDNFQKQERERLRYLKTK